jgi:hypothetical protein
MRRAVNSPVGYFRYPTAEFGVEIRDIGRSLPCSPHRKYRHWVPERQERLMDILKLA